MAEFADRNPGVAVSVLRMANVLGPDVRTSHIDLMRKPALPMILGFDPRYQFVHEDDVVHALEHVVKNDLPGVFNVAADGVLALSEVAGLLGKPYAPVISPWGTGLAATLARRLGVQIPPEMLAQLRFGRGVDNRRFKATGFEYGYTSREAVIALGEHLRLHPLLRDAGEPYRYEREVEEFLRWSPNVRNSRPKEVAAAMAVAEVAPAAGGPLRRPRGRGGAAAAGLAGAGRPRGAARVRARAPRPGQRDRSDRVPPAPAGRRSLRAHPKALQARRTRNRGCTPRQYW